jgi:hypothetical protein
MFSSQQEEKDHANDFRTECRFSAQQTLEQGQDYRAQAAFGSSAPHILLI